MRRGIGERWGGDVKGEKREDRQLERWKPWKEYSYELVLAYKFDFYSFVYLFIYFYFYFYFYIFSEK